MTGSAPELLKICVAHPNKVVYSETFVRAHVERLRAETLELWGGLPPIHFGTQPLVGQSLLHRGARLALRKALKLGDAHFHEKAIARFLSENGVHAVLAEYGPTGVSLIEACRVARVPLTVHFHGYDAYQNDTLRRYANGYKRLFAAAAAIVAVSNEMVEQLVSIGAPREKVRFNPCGADFAKFTEGDPASAPPVFIAVGRFTEKKAPFLTLLAFHKTHGRHPDARLVMIGDGPLFETCRRMAEALGISEAVDFRGGQRHEEIAWSMARARAFVQHSVCAANGDSEGTPVAVVEAAAAGLPVVATAHAGIKDVVRDGETGFLVAENDVDAMAAAMTRLAEDASLAGRMGRTARRTLPECYRMEKSIDALYQIVKSTARPSA